MGSTGISPATAAGTNGTFVSSPAEDASERTAQPKTSNSTFNAMTPSELSQSSDILTPSSVSQSSSPLLAIRTKGRKRTSGGNVKRSLQWQTVAFQGEGCVKSENNAMRRLPSNVDEDWPRTANSRSLSILTREKPKAASRNASNASKRSASRDEEETSLWKHKRQRSQLEWKNGSKFEELPQIR